MALKRGLVWFRRDLRLYGHQALGQAFEECEALHLVFIFDPHILDKLCDRDDKRVHFIFQTLMQMRVELRHHQTDLTIEYGDPKELIPKLANEFKVDCVYYNEDYEPYAIQRDLEVAKNLGKSRIQVQSFKDQVIFAKNEILSLQGSPFKVFTPYKKKWLESVQQLDLKVDHPKTLWNKIAKCRPGIESLDQIHFQTSDLPSILKSSLPSERLKQFKSRMPFYHQTRDQFDRFATSGLSVDLRFGTLSIRELVHYCLDHPNEGSQVWLSELIWREFFMMILYHHPHVEHTAWRPQYQNIRWPGTQEHFEKWAQGLTGFPLVDAAMRNLLSEGTMPNRLRMLCANFLVKILHVDWKKGQEHFARYLLDFDLSANNGNWQWSASTGTDAAPTFRIFNPFVQTQKFDSQGVYIRKYLPELQNEDPKFFITPWLMKNKKYPQMIVDYKEQRALTAFLYK